MLEHGRALPVARRDFHDDVVLVERVIDCRHRALPEGIVKRIVDLVHGQAEARCRIAIDHQVGFQALLLLIGIHVGKGWILLHLRQQLGRPFVNLGGAVAEHRVLVLRVARPAADANILHRLQEKLAARHARKRVTQTRHDHGHGSALAERFQGNINIA